MHSSLLALISMLRFSAATPILLNFTLAAFDMNPPGFRPSYCNTTSAPNPWGSGSEPVNIIRSPNIPASAGSPICRQIARYKLPKAFPNGELVKKFPSIPLKPALVYWLIWSSNELLLIYQSFGGTFIPIEEDWGGDPVWSYGGRQRFQGDVLPDLMVESHAPMGREIDGEVVLLETAALHAEQ